MGKQFDRASHQVAASSRRGQQARWMRRAAWRAGSALAILAIGSASALAQIAAKEDPDAHAARIEAQMTDDERFALLTGIMPIPFEGSKLVIPAGVPVVAGYVRGVPRLGVPAQLLTDASLGVTNPAQLRKGDVATAFPAGLAMAASFDPAMAERIGATIGGEARAKGFNVLLGGGMNLMRDPRNGRNFEYLGEDPLLSGTMAGHAIRGTQSVGVVSTIKHFALNAQETQRRTANAIIDEAALRESELLGFQIGIEIGQPGAVMCAYNLVNGRKSCGNSYLLNDVLKRDWHYKGWVMSDWEATDDVSYFMAGLDQQEGSDLDRQVWFDKPLRALVASGQVPRARLSDAVRRILRSMYAVGLDAPSAPAPVDTAANSKVALDAARSGIVLLKNDGILPLAATARKILLVGGNADFGVLSGAGSSQVTPSNGAPRVVELGTEGVMALFDRQVWMPGAPLKALRKLRPDAQIDYLAGYSAEMAAAFARNYDLVVVFGTKWQAEGQDVGSLALPQGQDELIDKLATANANTIVVLETGNPVTMPWLSRVRAVMEAWYPGQEGGTAIAEALTGAINPSGRLPITFPASLDQYPRRDLPGFGLPDRTEVDVRYSEGAEAGYRAFAQSGQQPLFSFGHGLSYTTFRHTALKARMGKSLELSVTVRNTGRMAGADVPQLYLVDSNGTRRQRLVGFQRVTLLPGETRDVRIVVDPRLMARWTSQGWVQAGGNYRFAVGASASDLGEQVSVVLPQRIWRD